MSDPVGSNNVKGDFKVIIAANRLPITITNEGGNFKVNVSSGGLVSALKGLSSGNMRVQWLGWPGADIKPEHQSDVERECFNQNCIPVFLDSKTIDYYYNGFCNNILWPLFHYIPPPFDFGCVETPLEEWQYYIRANILFTDAVVNAVESFTDVDDMPYIWVHDYHLMLVPMLLRKRIPFAKVGWFLHTPFPSQEVFRMLPFRTELLTGLLSANLVAFHVYDYTRHFLAACSQLLGLDTSGHGVDASPLGGDFVRVASIPIGIQPEPFLQRINSASVSNLMISWRKQFGDRKIILGIDRLDYMKGIPHKLNAFDRFLERYPEWNDRCILVQLAVPSRGTVPEYQKLKSSIHEMVGKINGKRGNLTSVPVHYLDQSVNMTELVALYRVADCAFITSLRDGMNLVAYEYIVCQKGVHGTLVLSEFAGAAQSLGAGSININPWNLESTASCLHQALTMSAAEKRARHEYCLKHVMTHTSQRWAETNLATLVEATEQSREVRAAIPPLLDVDSFSDDFQNSRSRLLVIDLMDCLVGGRSQRGLAMKRFQSLVNLPIRVFGALRILSNDENTCLILTSAQPMALMDRLFGELPAVLVAEKGAAFRTVSREWVPHDLEEPEDSDWQDRVARVIDWYQRRTPGSYTERTSTSFIWFWDDTQPDIGQQQARDLLVHLWAGPLSNIASSKIEVIMGPKSLEIRPAYMSREKLLMRVLSSVLGPKGMNQFQFVSVIGTFSRCDESVYSCFEDKDKEIATGQQQQIRRDSRATNNIEENNNNKLIENNNNNINLELNNNNNDKINEGIRSASSGSPSSRQESENNNFSNRPNSKSTDQENNRKLYSITVSSTISKAKFRLPNVQSVQNLIVLLSELLQSDTLECQNVVGVQNVSNKQTDEISCRPDEETSVKICELRNSDEKRSGRSTGRARQDNLSETTSSLSSRLRDKKFAVFNRTNSSGFGPRVEVPGCYSQPNFLNLEGLNWDSNIQNNRGGGSRERHKYKWHRDVGSGIPLSNNNNNKIINNNINDNNNNEDNDDTIGFSFAGSISCPGRRSSLTRNINNNNKQVWKFEDKETETELCSVPILSWGGDLYDSLKNENKISNSVPFAD